MIEIIHNGMFKTEYDLSCWLCHCRFICTTEDLEIDHENELTTGIAYVVRCPQCATRLFGKLEMRR